MGGGRRDSSSEFEESVKLFLEWKITLYSPEFENCFKLINILIALDMKGFFLLGFMDKI